MREPTSRFNCSSSPTCGANTGGETSGSLAAGGASGSFFAGGASCSILGKEGDAGSFLTGGGDGGTGALGGGGGEKIDSIAAQPARIRTISADSRAVLIFESPPFRTLGTNSPLSPATNASTDRELNSKGCSLSDLGRDVDASVMQLNNPINHGQPNPAALRLCCVIQSKDFVQVF